MIKGRFLTDGSDETREGWCSRRFLHFASACTPAGDNPGSAVSTQRFHGKRPFMEACDGAVVGGRISEPDGSQRGPSAKQSQNHRCCSVLHVTPHLSECSYVFRQLHAVTRCGSVGVSSRRRIDRGARKEERPESSEASCSKGLKG